MHGDVNLVSLLCVQVLPEALNTSSALQWTLYVCSLHFNCLYYHINLILLSIISEKYYENNVIIFNGFGVRLLRIAYVYIICYYNVIWKFYIMLLFYYDE